jgi:hypothetical protein
VSVLCLFLSDRKKNEEKEKTNEKKSTAQNKSCSKTKKEVLDCGKPINATQFDHLRGIANRHEHPHIPEPEVAMIFRKKGGRHSEVDMNELERRLKKSKKDVSQIHIFQVSVFFFII